MLKYVLASLFTLVVGVALAFSFSLSYFSAAPSGTQVELAWGLDNEAGINRFEIHRRIDGDQAFTRIYTTQPNGSLQYNYQDGDLLRDGIADNTQRSIFYKLVVKSGTAETVYYTTVSHNPSAVQRSWGSIKSMFR